MLKENSCTQITSWNLKLICKREGENSNKKDGKKKTQDTKSKAKAKAILSFEDDFETGDSYEPEIEKKRNIVKNPAVDTSFLPDAERQKELHHLRIKISEDFMQQQEKIKGFWRNRLNCII